MTWDEIAWLLGTTATTLLRWRKKGIRPNAHYLLALQDLADGMGLGRLLPIIRVRSASAHGPGDRIRAE